MSSSDEKMQEKLQRFFGINRREAIAVTVLLGLLALGALYRWLFQPQQVILPAQLHHWLDSIVQAQYAAISELSSPSALSAASDSLPSTPLGAERTKSAPSTPINLNTATKAELMSLPGVGEVIAERILEYRRQKRFESPEELLEIKGIGPKKYERLRPYIRVE